MTKAPERVWAFLTNDADDPGHMFGSCWTRQRECHESYIHEDHALALVAAGRAEVLDAMDAFNTLPPDENGHCWRESDLLDQEVMRLRARTLDDATAALKARDQRIRNEALREVLRLARQKYVALGGYGFCDYISALITEGQSDGE